MDRLGRIGYVNLSLIMLMVTGLGVFMIGMPKYIDDYWYMSHLKTWYDAQGIFWPEYGGNILKAGIPWQDIFDTWVEHYLLDNIRLGNIIVVILLLFPKWLCSALMLLCWIYCMFGTFRLVGIDWRRSRYVWLAVVMWGLLMPWANHMGSLDYQINYIVPTALGVLFLRNLWWKKSGVAVMSVCGFLLGAWHEGFAIPVLAGVIIVNLLDKESRSLRSLAGIMGILTGLACIMSCPGVWRMLPLSVAESGKLSVAVVAKVLLCSATYWIMLAIWLVMKLNDRKRHIARDRFMIFALASGLVPVIMMLIVRSQTRVVWWTVFISIAAIMRLIHLGGKDRAVLRWSVKAAAIVSTAMLIVQFVFTDVCVIRMRKELTSAVMVYQKNPEKSIFVNVTDVSTMPLACINMIEDGFFTYGAEAIGNYYPGGDGKRRFMMIPEQLRHVNAGSGRAVSADKRIRETEGRVFGVGVDAPEWRFSRVVAGVNGRNRNVMAMMLEFRPEGGDEDFVYIYPYLRWYESRYAGIDSLEHKRW